MSALLEEAAALQNQQDLFDMHVSQYLPLTRCQVLALTNSSVHIASSHKHGPTFPCAICLALMIL